MKPLPTQVAGFAGRAESDSAGDGVARAFRRPAAGLLIVLFLALIAAMPIAPMIIEGSWPLTGEFPRYVVLLDHFREAILAGVPYPRWLPELYGGYGYPTFVYYQPGLFYFLLPFTFVADDPLQYMLLGIYALFFLGCLGAYMMGREMVGKPTGLFAAALFPLTPYLYVNLYARGDLSELAAMLITPWPLVFLQRLVSRARKAADGGAPATLWMCLSLAAIIAAHPVTAMFYLPAFGAIAVGAIWASPEAARWRLFGNVAVAAILTLSITSPYWATVLQMAGYIDIGAATSGHYDASSNVVDLSRLLFGPHWQTAAQVKWTDAQLQLGLPIVVAAVVGAAAGWKIPGIRAAIIAYLILFVAMTPLSAVFWSLPGLGVVQFPWRILSVAAVLQVYCAMGLAHLYRREDLKRTLVFVTVLLLAAVWHGDRFAINIRSVGFSQADLADRKAGDRTRFENYAAMNEFLPRSAAGARPERSRGRGPILSSDLPLNMEPLPDSTAHRIAYRVEAPAPAGIVVNQLYLPGWVVRVDGDPVTREKLESGLLPDGRMTLRVESGEHVVEALYAGPPWAGARNLLAALVTLAALCGWMRINRIRLRLGRRRIWHVVGS